MSAQKEIRFPMPISGSAADTAKETTTSLLFYYGVSLWIGQEEQHTNTLRYNPFSCFTLVFLITYLAERSAVFAVAVGCRPLPRCSRCGCPAECYDHCHCSSPNLRTGSQDTSITTHVLTEELRPFAKRPYCLVATFALFAICISFCFRVNYLIHRERAGAIT